MEKKRKFRKGAIAGKLEQPRASAQLDPEVTIHRSGGDPRGDGPDVEDPRPDPDPPRDPEGVDPDPDRDSDEEEDRDRDSDVDQDPSKDTPTPPSPGLR